MFLKNIKFLAFLTWVTIFTRLYVLVVVVFIYFGAAKYHKTENHYYRKIDQ